MPNDPDEFKNLNGANNANDSDDIISSSFAVQFKPGDKTESVADKLKETRENLEKGFDPFKKDRDYTDTFKSNFKDEFDDFEFDSSISAFKPLAGTPAPAAETKPAESAEPAKPVEAAKPAEEPKPVSNAPVFPKDGGTFDKPANQTAAPEVSKEAVPSFNDMGSKQAKPADEKIFNSGNGLDFATSEHDKKTSPFMNAESLRSLHLTKLIFREQRHLHPQQNLRQKNRSPLLLQQDLRHRQAPLTDPILQLHRAKNSKSPRKIQKQKRKRPLNLQKQQSPLKQLNLHRHLLPLRLLPQLRQSPQKLLNLQRQLLLWQQPQLQQL